MPRFASESPVRVRVGDCLCPDAPHEAGDFVVLGTRLNIEAGAAATEALGSMGSSRTYAAVAAAILPYMIEDWDFLDVESKKPIPITPDTVAEALPWNEGGSEVINALLGVLNRPLSSRASKNGTGKSSPTTQTGETLVKPRSSSGRRKSRG